MNSKIDYNFYNEYQDNEFDTKLFERIDYIKDRYSLKTLKTETILKEYFVEIFSWSVLSKENLNRINKYMKHYKLTGIIDPCCGNSFHCYLFEKYLKLKIYAVDIQDEPHSWVPILEKDGRELLKSLTLIEHFDNALLLSWIDYETLTIDLLNLYQGKIIISVGNYEALSPNYLKLLKSKYNLLEEFILKMPWNRTEKVEIYIKKI